MTDDEFLNDRDCTPTPKGETPRTDSFDADQRDSGLKCEKRLSIALDLARDLERELARALRVVEAAKELAANCEEYEFDDGLGYAAQGMWWHDLDNALEEWEAGR